MGLAYSKAMHDLRADLRLLQRVRDEVDGEDPDKILIKKLEKLCQELMKFEPGEDKDSLVGYRRVAYFTARKINAVINNIDLEAIDRDEKLRLYEKVLWWIKQCSKVESLGPEETFTVEAWYTNHRGKYKLRVIRPCKVYWGSTEWHPEKQFLLQAWDEEQKAMRDFAIKDFDDVDPVQS